jgi:hypothetical protein
MTLKTAAGTAITQGAFPKTAGLPGHADDAYYTITADVYEEFLLPGTVNTYGTRLKWKNGQTVQLGQIKAAYPTPTITAFSPSTALATAGGTTITATGTNLRGVTAVTVGGTAATGVTVLSETSITFVTPAKAAATYDVVVTDDSGTLTKTAALTFA